uniref:Uncharacterized protein n=1 Tax=Oryza barthii TaxID=65489 RepID=A0A0D3HL68_9ORYZ
MDIPQVAQFLSRNIRTRMRVKNMMRLICSKCATSARKRMATPEQPKSVLQVVANVLERNHKKSVFLRNVGMHTKRSRMSAELEAEKRENAKLRLIVSI